MIGQIIKRVYFMQPKLRFRKFVFTLLVLSLTIPTTIQPGLTASKDQVWMSVPVFYATSRQYDKGLGMYSGRRSPEHTDHGLEYGIVTSVIPVPSSIAPNDIAIANLPLKSASPKDAKGHSQLEKLSREEFYKRLSDSTKSTKFNEACLFMVITMVLKQPLNLPHGLKLHYVSQWCFFPGHQQPKQGITPSMSAMPNGAQGPSRFSLRVWKNKLDQRI